MRGNDFYINIKNKKTITQVVVFLLLVIATTCMVAIKRGKEHVDSSGNATIAKEQLALVGEIGEFLVLPTEETPTIATVTDKSKLKGQQVFTDAKDGDVLLAYPIAKKLILYRAEQKLIIAIASIHD
jgi:hypothetical protein